MLDGQYFHEGYVTRNLDRAREWLSRLYGMRFETLDASGAVQTLGNSAGYSRPRFDLFFISDHPHVAGDGLRPVRAGSRLTLGL